jgi:hypothetical protein
MSLPGAGVMRSELYSLGPDKAMKPGSLSQHDFSSRALSPSEKAMVRENRNAILHIWKVIRFPV